MASNHQRNFHETTVYWECKEIHSLDKEMQNHSKNHVRALLMCINKQIDRKIMAQVILPSMKWRIILLDNSKNAHYSTLYKLYEQKY